MSTLRDDLDRRIEALYKDGQSQYQIAAALGVSQPTVSWRMIRAGIRRRTRWETFGAGSPDDAVRMYREGMSGYAIAKALGVTHRAVYEALRRANIQKRQSVSYPGRRAENNPAWRGGRTMAHGYVMLYVGPTGRRKKNYVQEHRHVMEQALGRALEPREIVHHLNGVRTDNRIENLTVTTRKDHEHYTYVKALQARIRQLELQVAQSAKPRGELSGVSPT